MILFIQNETGIVHKAMGDTTCRLAYKSQVRVPVTALQIKVFKLPHCNQCWPEMALFQRVVERELMLGGTK